VRAGDINRENKLLISDRVNCNYGSYFTVVNDEKQ
tara:strand:+ start:296 stop:400 length:105 start_codon:yes stop_codon:yes gene_type:complete